MSIISSGSFFIHLFSNADLDRHPDNTLTHFINTLARPITIPANERWMVALHSFACHNRVSNHTGIIRVKCDQLYDKSNTGKILGLHARLGHRLNNQNYWEPKHKEWFAFVGNSLDSLEISILDERGNQLQLARGQPTRVQLEVRKMMPTFSDIVLRVSSKRTQRHPTNRASAFKVDFPLELSAYFSQSPWVISLTSMTFNPNFRLPGGKETSNIWSKMRIGTYRDNMHEEILTLDIPMIVDSESVDSLVDYTEALFELLRRTYPDKHAFKGLHILYDGSNNRMKIFNTVSTRYNLTIYLPIDLCALLGFVQMPKTGYWRALSYPNTHSSITGAIAPLPYIQPVVPESLLIYTNFTLPMLAGTGESSILKILPFHKESNQESEYYTTIESRRLEFHEICQSDLSNLEFTIRKIDGNEVGLSPESEVILTLLLRKKDE